MTSLFPPFNRRNTLRKLPYFYEAGRGVFYKATASAMTLNLNFTTGSLDSRITFSRGTNATLTNSTGKITYAPANLLTYSQDYTQSAWNKIAAGTASVPVVTGSYTTAPDGTNTASKVVFVAPVSGDRSYLLEQPTIPASTITYVGSLYVKADAAGDVGKVILFRQVAGGGYTSITLTASWQRISSTEVYAANNFEIGLRPSNGSSTGTVSINLWGCQLEPVTYQTTPSTYNATTASAYYGPRFDYDPVTLACKGLLIEEQRTNLVLQSNNFSTSWGNNYNVTVTPSSGISPDGTNNAVKIAATTTFGTNCSQVMTSAGSASGNTFSVYVKQGTGPTTANKFTIYNVTTASNVISISLNYSTGAITYNVGSSGASAVNVGNGWWRIILSATTGISAGNTLYVYAGFNSSPATAGDYFLAYGAQLEAGAFATSYIPTTTATATRNADVASMTGSNFSSWYNQTQGTLITRYDYVGGSAVNSSNQITAGLRQSSGNLIYIYNGNGVATGYCAVGGADQAFLTKNAVSANLFTSVAFAFATNDFAAAQDGRSVTTDTSGTLPTPTIFGVGNSGNSSAYLNGHIASIQYYSKRLPNATLQSLTT